MASNTCRCCMHIIETAWVKLYHEWNFLEHSWFSKLDFEVKGHFKESVMGMVRYLKTEGLTEGWEMIFKMKYHRFHLLTVKYRQVQYHIQIHIIWPLIWKVLFGQECNLNVHCINHQKQVCVWTWWYCQSCLKLVKTFVKRTEISKDFTLFAEDDFFDYWRFSTLIWSK